MADVLCENLKGRGYFADALHGDLSQMMRDKVMNSFRNGTTEILIATDVAARGLDVDDVEAVFTLIFRRCRVLCSSYWTYRTCRKKGTFLHSCCRKRDLPYPRY